MSAFRDLMQFARESADPNFSLSVPEPAKQIIRELVAIVDSVHSLVQSTDGDYIDGSSFDGLAGEIQAVLREGGVIQTAADSGVQGAAKLPQNPDQESAGVPMTADTDPALQSPEAKEAIAFLRENADALGIGRTTSGSDT